MRDAPVSCTAHEDARRTGAMMAGKENPIPGFKKTPFWASNWFAEVIATVPAVIAAGLAAWDAYPAGRYLWLTISLVWLVVGQFIAAARAKKKETEAERQRNHDGLRAAAHVLYSVVLEALRRQGEDDPGLRVTIHRVQPPMDDPQHIQQVIPYVGGDGGGEDRLFPIRSGITGCAIRGGEPYIMDRQSVSEDDYRKELISEWHYTNADAKKATMDRFSAIAFPVTDRSGQQVIAVVYLDTHRKGAFTNEIQELVSDACDGISNYVGERYV